MSRNFIKIASLAVFVIALASAGIANAQGDPGPEDLEAAKAAFAKGKAAFDKKDYKGAIEGFKESYRLSKNPLLLYNIGFALDSADDSKLALFYYKKFLADTPKDASNRDVAKERAEALTRELAEEEAPEPPPEKTDPDPNTDKGGEPKSPDGFEHNVIGEVPPGKPVDVTAFAPKNVGWKVYLHYRAPGAAKFTTVEMKARYSELVGRVPAGVVSGNSFQYYVEARDIGDEMVARSGKSSSPHVVLIEKSARARYYPDFDAGDGGEADPLDIPVGGNERDSGPSDNMTYAKWGATGGAIGFVALSATFFAVAADASSSLEGVAVSSSQQDNCPEGRPCQPFSESERNLEARGKRFETLGNVFLGIGVVSGVTAGVLWYLESKSPPKSGDRVSTTPMVGPDFVGAQATVRF